MIREIVNGFLSAISGKPPEKNNRLTDLENGGLHQAMYNIAARDCRMAVVRGGREAYTSQERGIGALLDLALHQPEVLRGGILADRIVGKAAAMLCVLGGVKYVSGEIMTQGAVNYLEAHGVPYRYENGVTRLLGPDGTGDCPLELAVAALEDPGEAAAALEALLSGQNSNSKEDTP